MFTQHELVERLIENIERVRTGASEEEVECLLGVPGHRSDTDWVYYLDEHSGYLVRFGTDARVENVRSWVS